MEILKKLQSLIHTEAGLSKEAETLNKLLTLSNEREDSAAEFDFSRTITEKASVAERILLWANAVGARIRPAHPVRSIEDAVRLLGTEQVRAAAVILTVYEGVFRIGGDSKAWRREFQVSLVACELSRKLLVRQGFGIEEGPTVTLLRGISRALTACVNEKAWAEVLECSESQSCTQENAARQAFALSYSSISQGAVGAWRLPEHLYLRVAPVARPVLRLAAASRGAREQAISACAYDIAEVQLLKPSCQKPLLEQVLKNFTGIAPDSLSELLSLLEEAQVEVSRLCADLGINLTECAQLAPSEPEPENRAKTESAPELAAQIARTMLCSMGEISMAATGGSSSHALFDIACKGLALSLRASRTAFALRDDARGGFKVVAAHGMDTVLAKKMRMSGRDSPDAIHTIIATGRDFLALDPSRVKAKLPDWYRDSFGVDHCFALFPLTEPSGTIGFLYADWDGTTPPREVGGVHLAAAAMKAQLSLILNGRFSHPF